MDHTSTQQTNQQHGSRWHMWLMLACCLIPMSAIVAVNFFGWQLNTLLTSALVLACPLMMVFMMMGGHSHGSTSQPTSGRSPER